MKEVKRRDTQMLLGKLGDRALNIIKKERLRLTDMFRRLDENGDGVVSKLEFEDGIGNMDLNLTKVEIQKLQHALDRDGDGFIDYGELSTFLKSSDKERAANVKVREKKWVILSDAGLKLMFVCEQRADIFLCPLLSPRRLLRKARAKT